MNTVIQRPTFERKSTYLFDQSAFSALSGKKIEESDSESDWSSSESSGEDGIDADASPPSSPRAAPVEPV